MYFDCNRRRWYNDDFPHDLDFSRVEFFSYDEETAEKMKDNFGKVNTQEECCEKIVKIIKAV